MSGFDNGTLQQGVFFQAKQFGSILRGFGPPTPQAGVVGDVYIDVQTFNLYAKRSTNQTDPWGRFIFVVPTTYQAQLKWFVPSAPTNDIGVNGDFALLWGGFPNYGLQPSIFGPKAAGVWPSGAGQSGLVDANGNGLGDANGNGLSNGAITAPQPALVAVTLNTLYTAEDGHAI